MQFIGFSQPSKTTEIHLLDEVRGKVVYSGKRTSSDYEHLVGDIVFAVHSDTKQK